MSYLVTIPIITNASDRKHFSEETLNLFTQRSPSCTFKFDNSDTDHCFNLVQPNYSDQPILNFLHELYEESWIRFREGKYHIRDLDSFKTVCQKYNIRFRYPPTPIFSSPTSDYLHYQLLAAYWYIFACAQQQEAESEYLPTKDLPPLRQVELFPPTATSIHREFYDAGDNLFDTYTKTTTTPHDTTATKIHILNLPTVPTSSTTALLKDDESTNSSSTAPEVLPATPEFIPGTHYKYPTCVTRIESWNHAARCNNFRNEKRKRADPTFEFTPSVILPNPKLERLQASLRRPNPSAEKYPTKNPEEKLS
jgi:hypothetical protein